MAYSGSLALTVVQHLNAFAQKIFTPHNFLIKNEQINQHDLNYPKECTYLFGAHEEHMLAEVCQARKLGRIEQIANVDVETCRRAVRRWVGDEQAAQTIFKLDAAVLALVLTRLVYIGVDTRQLVRDLAGRHVDLKRAHTSYMQARIRRLEDYFTQQCQQHEFYYSTCLSSPVVPSYNFARVRTGLGL